GHRSLSPAASRAVPSERRDRPAGTRCAASNRKGRLHVCTPHAPTNSRRDPTTPRSPCPPARTSSRQPRTTGPVPDPYKPPLRRTLAHHIFREKEKADRKENADRIHAPKGRKVCRIGTRARRWPCPPPLPRDAPHSRPQPSCADP